MDKETKTPQELQLHQAKLQTRILAVILVVVLAFGAFAGLEIYNAVEMLNRVDLDQINRTVTSMQTAVDKVAALDVDSINTSIQSFAEAAKHLEDLDVEQLNALLESLSAAAENMESVSEKLKNLFVR